MQLAKFQYKKLFFITSLTVLVILTALKLSVLTKSALTLDEAFSVYHAQSNVNNIISELTKGNNPPLYEILLHYIISFFGNSELAVRLLSAVAGVGSAIMLFFFGKRFYTSEVGLLAAGIFVLSNLNTYHMQEARAYALFTFLCVVSFFLYLEIIRNSKGKYWIYFALTLVNSVLLYLHYFSVFIISVQALFLVLNFKKIPNKALLIGSFVITLLLFLPMLAVLAKRFFSTATSGTWLQPINLDAPYFLLIEFLNTKPAVWLSVFLLVLWFFLKWKTQGIRNFSFGNQLVLLWFALPLTLIWFVSLKIWSWAVPLFLERYLLFISPALFLLIAIMVFELFKTTRNHLIASMLIILTITLNFRYAKPDTCNIDEAVAKIKSVKTENTLVYSVPAYFDLQFWYYYNRLSGNNSVATPIDNQKITELLELENIRFIWNVKNLAPDSMLKQKEVILLVPDKYLAEANKVFARLDSIKTLKHTYKPDSASYVYYFD